MGELHLAIQLMLHAMTGELSSLEEALGALLTSGQLRPGVIKALWAIAEQACQVLATSGGSGEAARSEARSCFAVLAAASQGHPQHVATNLNLLIQVHPPPTPTHTHTHLHTHTPPHPHPPTHTYNFFLFAILAGAGDPEVLEAIMSWPSTLPVSWASSFKGTAPARRFVLRCPGCRFCLMSSEGNPQHAVTDLDPLIPV